MQGPSAIINSLNCSFECGLRPLGHLIYQVSPGCLCLSHDQPLSCPFKLGVHVSFWSSLGGGTNPWEGAGVLLLTYLAIP